jgi:hypothetical protein
VFSSEERRKTERKNFNFWHVWLTRGKRCFKINLPFYPYKYQRLSWFYDYSVHFKLYSQKLLKFYNTSYKKKLNYLQIHENSLLIIINIYYCTKKTLCTISTNKV